MTTGTVRVGGTPLENDRTAATETKARLRDLTTAYAAIDAVAGFEQGLVRRLVHDFRSLVDDVAVDSFGNVIASRFVDAQAPTLMISAHSDEIGAVVKAIEPDGFLRFAPIGGVLESLLVGRAVTVNGHPGVIGSRAGHIASPAERITAPAMRDLYIDLGFDTADDVSQVGIRVGDPVAYYASVRALSNADRISGKAIDNRIGCAIVVELARRLQEESLSANLQFVVAVQEEVGLRGAQVVTYRLDPTAAIVLDTMPAGGTPDVSSTRELTQSLGAGPVITLISQSGRAGAIAHPGMVRFLEQSAQRANVPVQRGVFYGGNSDAAAVQLVRAGIPTGIVNLARRYSHSPVETLDLNDAAHALGLLERAARDFDDRTDLSFLGANTLIDEP